VVASVEVNPSSLSLGALSPGQTVTKYIVVHGRRPFRVLDVVCEGGTANFSVKLPADARDRQAIPITFKAGDQPGKMQKKIKIKTDLGENAVPDVICQATILEPDQPTSSVATPAAEHGTTTTGFRGNDSAN
jgi:hypothetical protein